MWDQCRGLVDGDGGDGAVGVDSVSVYSVVFFFTVP